MQQSADTSSSCPPKIPDINASKKMGTIELEILPGSDAHHASTDATLFSSSLPVLLHEKLKLNDMKNSHQSHDDTISSLEKLHLDVEDNGILEDVENHTIGNLLPDDEDELLAGIADGFELGGLPNRMDDLEDYDLFGSGGGLELETDQQERLTTDISISRLSLSDGAVGNGVAHYGIANGVGTVAGEHPLGEHPSRTLFVRNINSNVEDSELRSLFEQYGDIRTLYTACKHRGFVMISYYDIRAARTAMRALQNKPLRRRKLDIHFSIPKDNPSEKDINQGTLVVFNLDPSVSNEDLRQIFGVYGEIKEIRETPHKRHHKFIEFYDVRAAEVALKSLNRSDIAGKRIKLEPSRPGGARRNLMQHLNLELEQDQSWIRHPMGSSVGNSPPGNWPKFSSPVDHSPLQPLSGSPGFQSMSPTVNNNLPGLASILHPQPSFTGKIAPIGNDHFRDGHVDHIFSNGSLNHRTSFQHSHSFPEPRSGQYPRTASSYGASSSNGSGIETLSGPQFLWGSPKIYPDKDDSSAWIGRSFSSNGQNHGFPFSNYCGPFFNSPQHHHHHNHHHIGSAPSGVSFEHHFGFYQDSQETSFIKSAGGVGLPQNDTSFMVNVGNCGAIGAGVAVPGNISENGSLGSTIMSPPALGPMFLRNGHFPGLAANSLESFTDSWHNRRVETNGNQIDNQKQFHLNLDTILSGEDKRTTLMIKNIPNKYTSKMLLAAIDEYHKGTYDFLYLPIDFKNKCNVGYAFINMLSPSHIIPFYETFNGKKWEKFNSEKVASLAYARIQGKAALIAHFQNSSLMNEDKRCRPIVFHSESSESGDQIIHEHLPSSSLNIQFRQSNESDPKDPPASPSKDVQGEKSQLAE